MTTQIINKLQEFNEEDWISYLQKLCFGLNPEPSLDSIAPELIQQLFWVCNRLDRINKATFLTFTKSLLSFLRTIPAQPYNSKLIYDLIYVVHSVKPLEQRRLLELIIRDQSFVNLRFGSDNLHLLLMKSFVFVEDRENLYLEEYLRNRLNINLPYSLYVIVFYYSYLGHGRKALSYLSMCLGNPVWTTNNEACEEIYNTLVDCIPQYINLNGFLKYLYQNKVAVDKSNAYFAEILGKFIEHLKLESSDLGLIILVKRFLASTSAIPNPSEVFEIPPDEIENLPNDKIAELVINQGSFQYDNAEIISNLSN